MEMSGVTGFDNLTDLLESIINKKVVFKNESDTRLLVNALYDSLADEDHSPNKLRANGQDEVIDDWFWEGLSDGYEWYDVFMFNFDVKSISIDIKQFGDLGSKYAQEDIEELIEETLYLWTRNVRRYIFSKVSKT